MNLTQNGRLKQVTFRHIYCPHLLSELMLDQKLTFVELLIVEDLNFFVEYLSSVIPG